MKLGTENKKKTALAVVLLFAAGALLVYQFTGDESAQAPGAAPASPAAKRAASKPRIMAHSLDPTLRFDLLKSSEDVTYKGNGRNIFSSAAPPPEIPAPETPVVPQGPPPPPPPPRIDLKFYGFEGGKSGAKRIFLLKGEDIFLAREGDVVDRRYKILHVGTNSVEVQDVLTNNTQTIYLSAG